MNDSFFRSTFYESKKVPFESNRSASAGGYVILVSMLNGREFTCDIIDGDGFKSKSDVDHSSYLQGVFNYFLVLYPT